MTESDVENEPKAEPAARPRRMFLARLAAAVRRQDWFVVALEVAIVVLGVVIGFQLTAWGQRQSDADRERAYLRQLADDLAETEAIMDYRDARMDVQTHYGLERLLGSLESRPRPPADSVAAWLKRSMYIASPRPVLGTAEAISSAGDLGLIRSDSLRAGLLGYLDVNREAVEDQSFSKEFALETFRTVYSDYVDLRIVASTPVSANAGAQVTRMFEPIPSLSPAQPWRPAFPVDVDALYDDPGFHRTLALYAIGVGDLARARSVMRESARTLRLSIESELGE